ncbi:hypothetical protein [uncultured Cetobacterium sp.]|uniref:hypothetical protein n=1 Tax=uncultured Cetobacterium sp. TaxID=527638 RepID=UPI00261DBC90|nr:hypothetical protein [uncultured Cetobacterium sp.]
MNIYIYNKHTLALEGVPVASTFEEFKTNPIEFYPDWNIDNNIASDTLINNPILDGDIIREKTREEQILLDNKLELLQDGEYLENNKIIIIHAPENLFKKKWNKLLNIWEEGANESEIQNEILKLMDEYTFLVEKKVRWHNCGFSTIEIEKEMKINELKRRELAKLK